MSLLVLTGAVRSGKSAMAERLAASRGREIVVAAAGWDGDTEMSERIEAHRGGRGASWSTVRASSDTAWIARVPAGATLLLDCLGTMIANVCHEAVGRAELAPPGSEDAVGVISDAIVDALLGRVGDTIVVTNEVGWGVVPEWASGRVFRDALGRANRRLIASADGAYLVVDGRCLDLRALPDAPQWPKSGEGDGL